MKARRARSALWVLLLAIFAFWWGISVLNITAPLQVNKPSSFDSYTEREPLMLYHRQVGTRHEYSGVVAVSSCENVSSGITTLESSELHVTILLTVSRDSSCAEASAALASQPFTAGVVGRVPVVDAVLLNGQAIPVRLIEE